MLNRSHAEHAIIALVFQWIIALPFLGISELVGIETTLLATLFAAGCVMCGVFIGREISQHEFRGGGPKKVTPLYGLTNHWSVDSIIDSLTPIMACSASVAVTWWLMQILG